jgi:hypothetical protein
LLRNTVFFPNVFRHFLSFELKRGWHSLLILTHPGFCVSVFRTQKKTEKRDSV